MQRVDDNSRFIRRCRVIAISLLLLLPALRLVEAAGRLVFLPSFYDSFWHALTAEMWFSPMWWLYTNCWFGWWAMCLLVAWCMAIPVVLLFPHLVWPKTFSAFAIFCYAMLIYVLSFQLEFSLGGRTQSEWVWRLRSRDPSIRREAATHLSHSFFKFGFPDGMIDLARAALSDDVLEVRQFAGRFFDRHPTTAAIPELANALSDDDAAVRSYAASAIGQHRTRGADVAEPLKGLLDDPEPDVRIASAEAYLLVGGDPAVGLPVLENIAGKPGNKNRIRAAEAFVKVFKSDPDRALAALRNLLRDDDREVRFYTELAVFDLRRRAKPLTPELLINLKDKDKFVRGSAAWALGQIGSPDDDVVAAVVPLLEDHEPHVRRDAVYSLGYMGAVQAIPHMKKRFDNEMDPWVKSGVREALDRLREHR